MTRYVPPDADPARPALGIQQPWAELILRGIKTIEVRTTDTCVRGPIYLYASRNLSTLVAARRAVERYDLDLDSLPRGVVVGEARLVRTSPTRASQALAACVGPADLEARFAWHLAEPRRIDPAWPIRFRPYGVWFYPWRRKPSGRSRR